MTRRDAQSEIAVPWRLNGAFASATAMRVRLEIMLTMALKALFGVALDRSLAGRDYFAAFAVNWNALQYADHAWLALDVREGAWNPSVTPVVRFIDPARESTSFARVSLSMWKGPRPLPADARVPRPGDRAAA